MGNEKASIWYMDGEFAMYYDERKPDFNEDREDIIEILLVPSVTMRSKYNIDDSMLNIDVGDNKLGMWVPYKEEHLRWITRGVAWPKLVILCGFDGSETDFMRSIDEKKMFFLINNLKQQIWRLQMLVKSKDDTITMISHEKNEYVRSLMDLDKLKGKQTEEYSNEGE